MAATKALPSLPTPARLTVSPSSHGRAHGHGGLNAYTNQTLTAHLLRGAAAVALLYTAVSLRLEHPYWALLAVVLSFVAMQGCPVCWTSGLVEKLGQRWRVTKSARELGS